MKIVSALLWSLLLACLCSFSSCQIKYPPPLIERCIHNPSNDAECADLRLPKEERSYERTNLTNYICTNGADETLMYNYVNKLRNDLIKCENKGNK